MLELEETINQIPKTNTITIKKPIITNSNGKSRLSADIILDKEGSTKELSLWFEVDQQWSEYLCHERSDAFLIIVLRHAMLCVCTVI